MAVATAVSNRVMKKRTTQATQDLNVHTIDASNICFLDGLLTPRLGVADTRDDGVHPVTVRGSYA